LGDFWKIRSLAIFAYRPSFVTISRRKIHLGTYEPSKYDIFTHIMGDQLLDVLVDEDEDQLILIGRTDWRGKINAFKVPVDKVKDLETLDHGTPIGVEQYDPLRDACCIQQKSDRNVLLVASMDTRRQRGKMYEIPLDRIWVNTFVLLLHYSCRFAFVVMSPLEDFITSSINPQTLEESVRIFGLIALRFVA